MPSFSDAKGNEACLQGGSLPDSFPINEFDIDVYNFLVL
jgi:hypothetical protein